MTAVSVTPRRAAAQAPEPGPGSSHGRAGGDVVRLDKRARTTQGPPRRLNVLVADAQTLFADGLALVLSHAPSLEVFDERPATGIDAVKTVSALEPDVAVFDLWLQSMNGVAATRMLAANAPGVRVVILAWFHGHDDVQQAAEAGAVEVVPKSAAVVQVEQAIYRAASSAGQDPQESASAEGRSEQQDDDERVWQRLQTLTPRELETLQLMAAGLPKEDIAGRLGVTQQTARTHVNRVLGKTGTHTQLKAVAVARAYGLLL